LPKFKERRAMKLDALEKSYSSEMQTIKMVLTLEDYPTN